MKLLAIVIKDIEKFKMIPDAIWIEVICSGDNNNKNTTRVKAHSPKKMTTHDLIKSYSLTVKATVIVSYNILFCP